MKVVSDRDRLRMTVVLAPVFRPGVLCDLIQQQLTDTTRTMIIDTRWLEIMHSPFLAELVQLYCHLQKRGVDMHLCQVSRANRRLFGYTRLDQLISLHDGDVPDEPAAGPVALTDPVS